MFSGDGRVKEVQIRFRENQEAGESIEMAIVEIQYLTSITGQLCQS